MSIRNKAAKLMFLATEQSLGLISKGGAMGNYASAEASHLMWASPRIANMYHSMSATNSGTDMWGDGSGTDSDSLILKEEVQVPAYYNAQAHDYTGSTRFTSSFLNPVSLMSGWKFYNSGANANRKD